MAELKRLVLDILKPHDPSVLELAEEVGGCESVDGVTVTLIETDQQVQNVKLTLEGESIDFNEVTDAIEHLGGTVHSIDEVAYGEYVVREHPTPQDRR